LFATTVAAAAAETNAPSASVTKSSDMTISKLIHSFLWPLDDDGNDDDGNDKNDTLVPMNASTLELLKSRALLLSAQLGDIWCKSLLLLHVACHGTTTLLHPSQPCDTDDDNEKQQHWQHMMQGIMHQKEQQEQGTTHVVSSTTETSQKHECSSNGTNPLVPTATDILTNDNKIVHTAIALDAPRCIIILASLTNTSCLTVQDEENGKRTPLFLAVEKGGYEKRQQRYLEQQRKKRVIRMKKAKSVATLFSNENTTSTSSNDDTNGVQHDAISLIQFLTKIAPTSAGIPDSRGRLPLHVAIESGYKVGEWHNHSHEQQHPQQTTKDKACHSSTIREQEDDGVLKDIFGADPRAVSIRDPVTRLYPFMLAAVDADTAASSSLSLSPPSDVLEEENESEACVVIETIFELLRADPSVLRYAPYV